MRLEEAADILGVPIDASVDVLKQTYRRLALYWHPDKSTKPNAKDKFQQISLAYTKLISNHSRRRDVDFDGEDATPGPVDDSHEMAAFMRMFMDLVGIFNEEHSLPVDMKMPAGGVSLGMMFGAHNVEEWSSDEDDGDMDDYDEDDDEYDDDDYIDSEEEREREMIFKAANSGAAKGKSGTGPTPQPSATAGAKTRGSPIWEPQAKNYSPMNLKESIRNERKESVDTVEAEQEEDPAELKRKQKNAKKRAEKRRKQKEKKQREAAQKAGGNVDEDDDDQDDEMSASSRKIEVLKGELLDHISNRNLVGVGSILSLAEGDSLEDFTALKESLFELPLLHLCVDSKAGSILTNSATSTTAASGSSGGSKSTKGASTSATASTTKHDDNGRMGIVRFILGQSNPVFDRQKFDESGLTALMLAAECGDHDFVNVLLTSDTKLDVNTMCNRNGWSALHYAANNGYTSICTLLLQAGGNLKLASKAPSTSEESGAKLCTAQDLLNAKLDVEKMSDTKASKALVQNIQKFLSDLAPKPAESKSTEKTKLSEKERKEKEQKEKEAKQKQQKEKEKLEKEKKAAEAEAKKKSTTAGSSASKVTTPAAKLAPSSSEKASSPSSAPEESVEVQDSPVVTSQVPVVSPPAIVVPAAGAVPAASSSKKSKKKKDKAESTESFANIPVSAGITTTAAVPIPIAATPQLPVSRDELLDQLLAMGFAKADCLTALSVCGKDIDLAITWLCENPPGTTVTPKTSSTPAKGGVDPVVSSKAAVTQPQSHSTTANSTPAKSSVSTSSAAPGSGNVTSTPGTPSSDAAAAAAKLQKEKDHKEELRRINRAWNAKAEDEKKKAEMERKIRETERQKEILAQQQLQKQLQQQQQQQQQQLLMMQQQQQMPGYHHYDSQAYSQGYIPGYSRTGMMPGNSSSYHQGGYMGGTGTSSSHLGNVLGPGPTGGSRYSGMYPGSEIGLGLGLNGTVSGDDSNHLYDGQAPPSMQGHAGLGQSYGLTGNPVDSRLRGSSISYSPAQASNASHSFGGGLSTHSHAPLPPQQASFGPYGGGSQSSILLGQDDREFPVRSGSSPLGAAAALNSSPPSAVAASSSSSFGASSNQYMSSFPSFNPQSDFMFGQQQSQQRSSWNQDQSVTLSSSDGPSPRFVDGSIELSAVAAPFVPKFSSFMNGSSPFPSSQPVVPLASTSGTTGSSGLWDIRPPELGPGLGLGEPSRNISDPGPISSSDFWGLSSGPTPSSGQVSTSSILSSSGSLDSTSAIAALLSSSSALPPLSGSNGAMPFGSSLGVLGSFDRLIDPPSDNVRRSQSDSSLLSNLVPLDENFFGLADPTSSVVGGSSSSSISKFISQFAMDPPASDDSSNSRLLSSHSSLLGGATDLDLSLGSLTSGGISRSVP